PGAATPPQPPSSQARETTDDLAKTSVYPAERSLDGPTPVLVPGYEILEELGRGGMGVVYKARQVRLKRLVALKMILARGHASEDDRARFRREAEAEACLQHPNIVQVYEINEHEGLDYFALEYVDGGSLAQRLRTETVSPADAAALVAV